MSNFKKLSEFIDYVKTDGFALSSQFAVSINKPKKLFTDGESLASGFTQQNVLMLCERASIPGMTFLTSPVRTTGEIREVPYEKSFDPVQLVFLLDRNLQQKFWFDRWFDLIQADNTKIFQYPDDYTVDVNIYSIDRNNGQRLQTTLFQTFPKTIGMVDLDYNNKDVARLPVVLSYKYFRTFYKGNGGSVEGNGYYDKDSSLAVDLATWISEFQGTLNGD